ncbi:hypothetical protein PF002_g22775 [Phytophthora fragariae]|uniref:Uncharacterized protein n=1 Tax=Phytophthora fragariae TaxID=53985 RepID=A0A6A3X6H4_9STRA|nr:hypothetical protein PF002_g22775 [Phytophthora fragariae]
MPQIVGDVQPVRDDATQQPAEPDDRQRPMAFPAVPEARYRFRRLLKRQEARDSSRRLYTARRPLCMELNGEGDKEVQFFLDPYSRPKEKNGGAWMNTCLHRSRLLSPKEKGGKRIQVAYIMCSQSQRLIWLPFGQQRKRVLVR